MEITQVLSKELTDKIIGDIQDLKPEVYWNYRDELEESQISEILSNLPDSLYGFENEIYEMNIDYITGLEWDYVKSVINDYEDDIKEELGSDYEEEDLNELISDFRDYLPSFDMRLNDVYPSEILCLIKVYSNYDCTNSFDDIEEGEDTYLGQVYQRVKEGVKKDDFVYEHQNGAYGGSLFCFVFTTDFETLLELKENIKKGKRVYIPKGTQFGFFSSFQGAGSCFEKTTFRDMELNIKEEGNNYNSDYDHIDIIADCEQSYNIEDVYGADNTFASEQDIRIVF